MASEHPLVEPSDDAVEFSDGERVVIVCRAALLFSPFTSLNSHCGRTMIGVVETQKGSKDGILGSKRRRTNGRRSSFSSHFCLEYLMRWNRLLHACYMSHEHVLNSARRADVFKTISDTKMICISVVRRRGRL